MAGFTIEKHQKSRQGRKVLADGHHVLCRPSRDFHLGLTPTPALKGWAIVSGLIPVFLGNLRLKPAGSLKSSRRSSNWGLVREIERFARDFEGFDREFDPDVRCFGGSVR